MVAVSAVKQKEILFTVNDEYVFDIAYRSGVNDIAVSASNQQIKLYDCNSLELKGSWTAHESTITQIEYSTIDPNLLLSSSADATLKVWDCRTISNPILIVNVPKKHPVTTFSVNSTGNLLCIGTELVKSDASIHFYDFRAISNSENVAKLIHTFTETHSDDITQLCFHPQIPERLLSGSVDGLTCVYDLQSGAFNEDEAVMSVINSGSSVNMLGWFGSESENIWLTTHDESASLWNMEGSSICNFGNVRDLCQSQCGTSVDYIVDCLFDYVSQQLYIMTGTHAGGLAAFAVDGGGELRMCFQVPEGNAHQDVIRSVLWDFDSHTLISGGEDARLCVWKLTDTSMVVQSSNDVTQQHSSRHTLGGGQNKQRATPY